MKLGRWISLMALLVALYLMWRIRQVLLLIFTAIILTIPLNRLVKRWQRTGMWRSFANLFAFLTLLTLLLLFGSLIVPPFVEQLQSLTQIVILGLEQLLIWILQLQDRLPEAWRPAPTISLAQQARPLIGWMFDHFFALFSDLITLLLHSLLILVLTLMLLANPSAYRRSLIRLFPFFYRERIDAVLSECEDKLASWMQMTLWEMLAVGGATAVALWLLQVPLVLTNAAIAGSLEVIPNLGVLLSVIPPFAAAWLSSPEKAIAVVVLYLVVQVSKHYCLQRFGHRFQPQRPGTLLPAIMLLAQLSLAFFCGFTGLLLAVPIVIVVQVCAREILLKDVFSSWKQPDGGWRKIKP